MKCLSKNGLIVDNKICEKGEMMSLKSTSIVRMGNIRFRFSTSGLPTPKSSDSAAEAVAEYQKPKEKEKKEKERSYLSYVGEAFEALSHNRAAHNGFLQREIVDWIVKNNSDYFTDPKRKLNLNQGVYITLNKFYVKGPDPGGDDKKRKNKWLGLKDDRVSGTQRNVDDYDDEDEDDDDNVDDDDEDDDEDGASSQVSSRKRNFTQI